MLAIDTATPAVTAGIVRRDGDRIDVLAERVTVDARAHAEQLTPNVLAALADAGITVNDLTTVVVGCGPGPFTGLRVGMATAAAYGHALGIPVHGVCSLDAIGIDTGGGGAGGHRRPSPRGVLGALPRRGTGRRARRERARRRAGDVGAVAGSPEHAALFGLPRQPAIYPTASGLVRRRRLGGAAAAAGAAVSAPTRRQAA